MKLSSDCTLAYLTSWKRGIIIVEIKNPYNPFVVGRATCNCEVLPDDETPYGPYGVAGISVHGNYAICVTCDYSDNKHRESLIVYDIEDPSNPSRVEIISTAPWRNHGITARGNYAYTSGFEGILIYDIADPTDPIYINRYESKERMCCVSAIRENLLFKFQFLRKLILAANFLSSNQDASMRKVGERLVFVSAFGLRVIDVSDPSNPEITHLFRPSDRFRITSGRY